MPQMPNTHWIWLPDWSEQVNGTATLVRFRRSITLADIPKERRLKISADTRYKLYVNGAFVECGPARGDARVWYVDTVDIAPYLKSGENVVAVEVLRYPLAYRSGNFGMARTATPGLFVEEDGELSGDERWKCRIVEGFRIVRENPGFAPMMILEEASAASWERGWKLPGYDDTDWYSARPYNVFEMNSAWCPADLTERPIPYMWRISRHFTGIVPKYDAETAETWEKLLRGEGTVRVKAGETAEVELDAGGVVGKTGGHISGRYWSFIDWSIPWGPTVGTPPSGLRGPITMESLLYIYGLQHAAKLCDYVGRSDTASEYRARAKAVQDAVNALCRDEDGFYLDSPGVKEYSQHCQVFAILTDTVSVEEGRKLLLATLEDKEKFAQCTVASMFYVFRALEKTGDYGRTEPLWDTWRGMLKNNLTTCVENYTDERSDCHAWGSVLLYELPAVILGVRPAAPGYERVLIDPKPGYLTSAKGDVVTRWGTVHVEWELKNGKPELHIEASETMKERIVVHE